ncbi:MAG: LUD domain-containing protein [Chloroflexia bacterium]|nr:LUD domain-containing protein [Chloroflexia bacterium]
MDHRRNAVAFAPVLAEDDIQGRLREFREKAEPLGVTVIRTETQEDAARAIAEWVFSFGADDVVATVELMQRATRIVVALEEAGVRIRAPASPEETRDTAIGLSLGHLAIAETGSVLLCEPSLADRSVGMLSLAQVIICATSALVTSLDDATANLRRLALQPGGSFATLVTGPSRTADIERVLTVGVQGPGSVMTLFIDEL